MQLGSVVLLGFAFVIGIAANRSFRQFGFLFFGQQRDRFLLQLFFRLPKFDERGPLISARVASIFNFMRIALRRGGI